MDLLRDLPINTHEELFDHKGEILKKNKISFEKDSLQYNSQDLDQEQRMDVNPLQLNTQNFHVHMIDKNELSSKISGITYMENSKKIVGNVVIILFFGHESKEPVFKTNSDQNGNFVIGELPPGYYILHAYFGKLKYQSHSIKVLPCQNVDLSVLLK